MKSWQAETSGCAVGNGEKIKAFGNWRTKPSPQSCLMPKSFLASSQVTIAAALAGKARTMVGPRPV